MTPAPSQRERSEKLCSVQVFAAPDIFAGGCAGKSRFSVLIDAQRERELRFRPHGRLGGGTRSFLLGLPPSLDGSVTERIIGAVRLVASQTGLRERP